MKNKGKVKKSKHKVTGGKAKVSARAPHSASGIKNGAGKASGKVKAPKARPAASGNSGPFACHCRHCGYRWNALVPGGPRWCARCKVVNWNRPKKVNSGPVRTRKWREPTRKLWIVNGRYVARKPTKGKRKRSVPVPNSASGIKNGNPEKAA